MDFPSPPLRYDVLFILKTKAYVLLAFRFEKCSYSSIGWTKRPEQNLWNFKRPVYLKLLNSETNIIIIQTNANLKKKTAIA